MGNKYNPRYREQLERMLENRVQCAYCGTWNHPRYMIIVNNQYFHRQSNCYGVYEEKKKQKEAQMFLKRQTDRRTALNLKAELKNGVSWQRLIELKKIFFPNEDNNG